MVSLASYLPGIDICPLRSYEMPLIVVARLDTFALVASGVGISAFPAATQLDCLHQRHQDFFAAEIFSGAYDIRGDYAPHGHTPYTDVLRVEQYYTVDLRLRNTAIHIDSHKSKKAAMDQRSASRWPLPQLNIEQAPTKVARNMLDEL